MNVRSWLWIGLATLALVNLVVGVAWLGRDRLVTAGWLADAPATRLDLPPRPLPGVARPSGVAETPTGDAPSAETSAPPVATPPPSAEMPSAETPSAATPSAETPVPSSMAASDQVCIALGPFEKRDEAAAASARIESAGGEALVVEQRMVGEPDHLVYVEPAASRALAHRTWQELVAQGIDAFVIPRGERENGISVGVFAQRDFALAQRDRVSALGFEVGLRNIPRSHTAYLVQTRAAPADAIADYPGKPCEVAFGTDRTGRSGAVGPAGVDADVAGSQSRP